MFLCPPKCVTNANFWRALTCKYNIINYKHKLLYDLIVTVIKKKTTDVHNLPWVSLLIIVNIILQTLILSQ